MPAVLLSLQKADCCAGNLQTAFDFTTAGAAHCGAGERQSIASHISAVYRHKNVNVPPAGRGQSI